MFAFNRFLISFTLLFKILIHLMALSNGLNTTPESWTLRPGHAKAGHYSWDKDLTCGLVKYANESKSRISEGVRAQLGEFPWIVGMFVGFVPKPNTDPNDPKNAPVFWCHGVIISDYWIITAKTCITDLNFQEVRLIEFFAGSKYKYEAHDKYQIRTEGGFIVHPEYDIGLFRTAKRIQQKSIEDKYRVNRVCLPVPDLFNREQEDALFSGFGDLRRNGAINLSDQSWTIRKAKYAIQSVDECKNRFNLPEVVICAMTAKQSICFHDWGSGLIQFDGQRAVLIGVAHQHYPNPKACGDVGGYDVFARVSTVVNWIKNAIESDTAVDFVPTTRLPYRPTRPTVKIDPELRPEAGMSDSPVETTTSDCDRLSHQIISISIPLVLILNIFI